MGQEIGAGFMRKILQRENSLPDRFAKKFRWKMTAVSCREAPSSSGSGVFENQSPAIVQVDFLRFPHRTLVEPLRVRLSCFPGLVEPVQVRFVVGNPFLDRLPGWFDRHEGLDVEGRFGRWRDVDDAFPKAVKSKEEFDLLRASDEGS